MQKSSAQEKMATFFELADIDGNGSIDKEEMFFALKISGGQRNLRKAVDDIFAIADVDRDGELTKKELLTASQTSKVIKDVVDRIVKDYHRHQTTTQPGVEQKPFNLIEYFKNYRKKNTATVSYPGPVEKVLVAFTKAEKQYAENRAARDEFLK